MQWFLYSDGYPFDLCAVVADDGVAAAVLTRSLSTLTV
jgi:hypothetical protein